jgi:hypothetical protein
MLYNFNDFLKEQYESDILYILGDAFEASALVDWYEMDDIKEWMSKFDFDYKAHVIFVSDKKTKECDFDFGKNNIVKNKLFFRSKSKYSGVILPDSELVICGNKVSLYLFERRKNDSLRTSPRQVKGFSYENSIKYLNNLSKFGINNDILGHTDKWDAYGSMDNNFLNLRICNDYSIDLYNGSNYVSLINNDDITGYGELDVENKLLDEFHEDKYWNIKTCSTNEINLSAFVNIAGLGYNLIDNKGSSGSYRSYYVKKMDGDFVLTVGQYSNGVLINEYIVIIPFDRWVSYLPDLKNPDTMKRIDDMYLNLGNYVLVGERDDEVPWKEFINEYSKITKDSIIKLRFKRGKDQLRIQCSMSWKNFIDIVLKENIHIRNSIKK